MELKELFARTARKGDVAIDVLKAPSKVAAKSWELKYDPNQPRDHGKFGSGGASENVPSWKKNLMERARVGLDAYRGTGRGIGANDHGVAGKGEYHSGDKEVAAAYGANVQKSTVKLNNPFIATYSELNGLQKNLYGQALSGFEADLSEKFDRYLRDKGYDGAILIDPEISKTVPQEIVKFAATGHKSLDDAIKKYDPRQARDDHGRWNDGAGGISIGHALHVMKSEGIADTAHHDAVRSAIESGQHKTREDVLAHIDSIHAGGGEKHAIESKAHLDMAEAHAKESHSIAEEVRDAQRIGRDDVKQGDHVVIDNTLFRIEGISPTRSKITAREIQRGGNEAEPVRLSGDFSGKRVTKELIGRAVENQKITDKIKAVRESHAASIVNEVEKYAKERGVATTRDWGTGHHSDVDLKDMHNRIITPLTTTLKDEGARASHGKDVLEAAKREIDGRKLVADAGFTDHKLSWLASSLLRHQKVDEAANATAGDEWSENAILVAKKLQQLQKQKGRKSLFDFDAEPDTGETQSMKTSEATTDDEMPAPLPDPFGLNFTDAELESLTDVDSEEAVKLAFAQATPEKRALLAAQENE